MDKVTPYATEWGAIWTIFLLAFLVFPQEDIKLLGKESMDTQRVGVIHQPHVEKSPLRPT